MMRTILLAMMAGALLHADERVQLRIDTSEAESVLAIVAKRQANQPIRESDWQPLLTSEPYQRLKQREASLQRTLSDEDFQQFVLSEELLGRAEELRRTLDEWRARDLNPSARRVLDFLPRNARIHATVYPVIKRQTNSFVYDVRGDAAIFLYLDPQESAAKFENTVAHELHHIGFASVAHERDSILANLPDRIRMAVEWRGAFGEGLAMLAAAGDADTHPHTVSSPAERSRWDRDMNNFNRDVRDLEQFFLDIIEGRVTTESDVRQRAFSFFGQQGPWYTVGYGMAVAVERRYGRETLIASMLDPRQLLVRYNAAAAELNAQGGKPLALWSPHLLQQIASP